MVLWLGIEGLSSDHGVALRISSLVALLILREFLCRGYSMKHNVNVNHREVRLSIQTNTVSIVVLIKSN